MESKLTKFQNLVSQFISEEFTEDESGQGITEYGAVLAFVALLIAMVFMAGQGMNSSVSSLFNAPVNQLERVVAYDASGAGADSGASSGGSAAANSAASGSSSSASGSSGSSSASSGSSNSNAGGNGNGNSNSKAGGNGNGNGNGNAWGRGGNTRFTR